MTTSVRTAVALWKPSTAAQAVSPAHAGLASPGVRRSPALLRSAVAVSLLALAAGCTQLPKPELKAYSEAFQATQTAATPMIANYAVAERSVRLANLKRDCVETPGPNGTKVKVCRFDDGYAADFRLADVPAFTTIGLPPAADAIDRTFRGIAAYNDTLVALAENRNVEEARGQLKAIIGDVGAIVPGAEGVTALSGPLADLVTNVFGKAVEIDNRAQFKRLIVDGEPKVVALIELLRQHTGTQYEATIRELDRKARKETAGSDEHKALVAKIAAWHVVFADYVTMLNMMEKRLGDLKSAVENPRSQPLLARAQAGAGELRAYADRLRTSITQLQATP